MHLKNTKIPIVEMFSSIQGEGKRIYPATFVRTGLCCFTCAGFGCELQAPDGSIVKGCDSIRAVSPKFKGNWTYYDNYNALVQEIQKHLNPKLLADGKKPDIVFTGGEPLLYWNNAIYQSTLAYYISRGYKLTIETNASLDIEFFRQYQNAIMFSMSPKLQHSGEPKERRINIETITKIIEHCPNSYLKFVINPKTWKHDKLEIYEILNEIPYYIDVFLMPLGGDRKQLQENTQFVVEKCIEEGFSFSDRCHIRAFDIREAI